MFDDVKSLFAVFLAVVFSISAVAREKAAGDSPISFAEATATLHKAWDSAESLEILEGLPGQFAEGKLFLSEKTAKATVQLDGEWFYAKAQRVSGEDVIVLGRLLTGDLLRSWRGMKFCGGFHADFAVSFISRKSRYTVLFCFGCHESRIMRESLPFQTEIRTPDFRLTVDLNPKIFEEVRTLLARYRKERPIVAKTP